jgi:hypothetical protein
MKDHRTAGGRRRARLAAVAALLFALASAGTAAGDHLWMEARTGLGLAESAARIWSPDAALVYVENDEDVDPAGSAPRWGYLFYSPSRVKARAYSIRDQKIVVAEDLEIKLQPPPVTAGWIDSGAARRAGELAGGQAYCRDHQGRLGTMLLLRGAFSDQDADRTTWMLVYTSPATPSLFVVVDAVSGAVFRTWRG